MLAFIAGGAASGKSAWAESLAMALGGRKCYIATMEPFGEEAEIRIQHHRNARREKGFQTAEIYTGMAHSVGTLCCDTALLECMTNWMANEMYSPDGAGEVAVKAICQGIEHLRAQCQELVIVSNEVFSGGSDYEGDTLHYLQVLAEVNRALARQAECVYEVVCGMPICHKGGNTR